MVRTSPSTPLPDVPGTGMPRTFFLPAGRLRPRTAPAAAPATAVTTGTPTALTAVQPAWPADCAALDTVSTGVVPLLDAVRELDVDLERVLPVLLVRERSLLFARDAAVRFCASLLPEAFDRLP